jgi:hypothetical protein
LGRRSPNRKNFAVDGVEDAQLRLAVVRPVAIRSTHRPGLPTGGAVFLLNLMTGQSLGEAATSALQVSPDFDIAANIAGLIVAGAFAAITFGDA